VLIPQLHLAIVRSRQHIAAGAKPVAASDGGPDLTGRQIEILRWVQLGKTNHEIALIVGISELTVKNHLQKVFKKLNVHNRTQAVGKLMALGDALQTTEH
jgi:DNA-binding CsgD family transcriptional regulator